MQYFPPIKRNEELLHAISRTNIKNIMLSTLGKTQTPHTIGFYFL